MRTRELRATAEELSEGSVDVDDYYDEKTGFIYMGRARRQADGTWRCLANVHGALCLVEVTIALPTFGMASVRKNDVIS